MGCFYFGSANLIPQRSRRLAQKLEMFPVKVEIAKTLDMRMDQFRKIFHDP